MERNELKPIVEALLFVSGESLSLNRIYEVIGREYQQEIQEVLLDLRQDYGGVGRGLQIVEVAGGYQITTRVEMAPWIKGMEKTKTTNRLSRPGLETLAIVVYKQPVTRAEIEAIRGVDVAGVLKTLMERKLIKVVGRKEVVGRPIVYGSTQEFLQYLGLPNLSALPTLKEFSDLLESTEGAEIEAEGQALLAFEEIPVSDAERSQIEAQTETIPVPLSA